MAQNRITWFQNGPGLHLPPLPRQSDHGNHVAPITRGVMHHGARVQKGPVWYRANQLVPLTDLALIVCSHGLGAVAGSGTHRARGNGVEHTNNYGQNLRFLTAVHAWDADLRFIIALGGDGRYMAISRGGTWTWVGGCCGHVVWLRDGLMHFARLWPPTCT